MPRSLNTSDLATSLLPYDYTVCDWYQKPMNDSVSMWTHPYVDQRGLGIIMCTYAQPIIVKGGKIIGVFFADVPMEDVSLLAQNINSGISKNTFFLMGIHGRPVDYRSHHMVCCQGLTTV